MEFEFVSSKNLSIKNKSALQRIKKVWAAKEADILSNLRYLTNTKFVTNKIICEINPYDSNGYYGYNNIAIGIYKNPQAILQVIAHELIHILYWRKIKKLKLTNSVLGKEKPWEWALSEFTVYLMQKDPKMIKFWPDEKIPLYPEAKKVSKLVKKFWKCQEPSVNRVRFLSMRRNSFTSKTVFNKKGKFLTDKDFDNYLIKSYNILRNANRCR